MRWFGDTVACPALAPNEPFRALTAAVKRRFPQTPPNEGAHPEVSVPYPNIGHDAAKSGLAETAAAVETWLSIRAAGTPSETLHWAGTAKP